MFQWFKPSFNDEIMIWQVILFISKFLWMCINKKLQSCSFYKFIFILEIHVDISRNWIITSKILMFLKCFNWMEFDAVDSMEDD